ncbi:hypothetical protein KAT92_06545 [Candidatus Babeliales bacterium]|nr:hypothetical protein [Candidatus Babeliales bacterium]
MTEREMLASISTKLDLLMEYNKDDHDNIFDRLRELEQKSTVCSLHSDIESDIVKLKVNDEKIKGEVKLLTVKTSGIVTIGIIFIAAVIEKLLNS